MTAVPLVLLVDAEQVDNLVARARAEDRDAAVVLAERLGAELPAALAEAAAALLAEGAEAERRLADVPRLTAARGPS